MSDTDHKKVSRVCVYCGSARGGDPEFAAAARGLGREIVRAGITLVYGGGAIGLMGELADAVLEAGGEAIGVIPRDLFSREVPHPRLTRLIEVSSLHERKQTMFELADAFVALPGGFGTLEELTEMATWSQLGLHTKPIVTLDVRGYWSEYHGVLRRAVSDGFIKERYLDLIVNVTSVSEILPTLMSYVGPVSEHQIDLDAT